MLLVLMLPVLSEVAMDVVAACASAALLVVSTDVVDAVVAGAFDVAVTAVAVAVVAWKIGQN